jgi:hypothetical protein
MGRLYRGSLEWERKLSEGNRSIGVVDTNLELIFGAILNEVGPMLDADRPLSSQPLARR